MNIYIYINKKFANLTFSEFVIHKKIIKNTFFFIIFNFHVHTKI